jgi:hypothetical protein
LSYIDLELFKDGINPFKCLSTSLVINVKYRYKLEHTMLRSFL